MQYSFDKISTVQAHDALLVQAQKKKRTLERKRRKLGEAISDFSQRIDCINKDMAEVRASLAALTPAYHAMPEGKEKATLNVMIKRLALRMAKLEKQAYSCNVAALLVKEMKYNVLDSQVSAMEDYIDTLERVRTARSESTLSVNEAGDLSLIQQYRLILFRVMKRSRNPLRHRLQGLVVNMNGQLDARLEALLKTAQVCITTGNVDTVFVDIGSQLRRAGLERLNDGVLQGLD